MKDSIVESVIEQFKQRSNVGINKYGTTMDRNDLSTLEWMIHFREELMDGLLYLERIIQDNKKSTSTSTWYDESLEQRINIIIDFNWKRGNNKESVNEVYRKIINQRLLKQ